MTVLAASALLKMAYSAFLAGVATATVFSLAIYGVIRSSDMRRAERDGPAAAYATLAGFGVLASVAIVVYGVYLVAHKS